MYQTNETNEMFLKFIKIIERGWSRPATFKMAESSQKNNRKMAEMLTADRESRGSIINSPITSSL